MGGTGFVGGYTISAVVLSQTTSTSTAASDATLAPVAVPTTPAEGVLDNTTDAKTATDIDEHDGREATMIGLSAGLGVGLPLFAGTMVALFFLRRLRGQSTGPRKQTEEESAGVVSDGNGMAHTMQEVRFHEVEALPAEMPNSRRDFHAGDVIFWCGMYMSLLPVGNDAISRI